MTPIPELDYDQLLQRCMGMSDLATKMMTLFHDQAREKLEAVEQSIVSNDPERVATSAHAFKGVAATLCCQRLNTMLAELEAMGREKDMNGAEETLQDLKAELDRCLAHVRDLLDGDVAAIGGFRQTGRALR